MNIERKSKATRVGICIGPVHNKIPYRGRRREPNRWEKTFYSAGVCILPA